MQDDPTSDERDMDGTVLWRLCENGLRPWRATAGTGARCGGRRGTACRLRPAHRMDGGAFVVASVAGRHAHSLDPTYR